MSDVPEWIKKRLQCPTTRLPLVEETHAGRRVYVARPQEGEPLFYEIENGVPILLPQS